MCIYKGDLDLDQIVVELQMLEADENVRMKILYALKK